MLIQSALPVAIIVVGGVIVAFFRALLVTVIGGLIVNFLDPGLARFQSLLGMRRPDQAVFDMAPSGPSTKVKEPEIQPKDSTPDYRSRRGIQFESEPTPTGTRGAYEADARRLEDIRNRELQREAEERAELQRQRAEESEEALKKRYTEGQQQDRSDKLNAIHERFQSELLRIQERLDESLRTIQEREETYRTNFDARLQRDLEALVRTKENRILAAERRKDREVESAQRTYEREVSTVESLGNALGGNRAGNAAAVAGALKAQRTLESRLKRFEEEFQTAVKSAEEVLAAETADLYARRKEEADRTLSGFEQDRKNSRDRATSQRLSAEKSRDESLSQLK